MSKKFNGEGPDAPITGGPAIPPDNGIVSPAVGGNKPDAPITGGPAIPPNSGIVSPSGNPPSFPPGGVGGHEQQSPQSPQSPGSPPQGGGGGGGTQQPPQSPAPTPRAPAPGFIPRTPEEIQAAKDAAKAEREAEEAAYKNIVNSMRGNKNIEHKDENGQIHFPNCSVDLSHRFPMDETYIIGVENDSAKKLIEADVEFDKDTIQSKFDAIFNDLNTSDAEAKKVIEAFAELDEIGAEPITFGFPLFEETEEEIKTSTVVSTSKLLSEILKTSESHLNKDPSNAHNIGKNRSLANGILEENIPYKGNLHLAPTDKIFTSTVTEFIVRFKDKKYVRVCKFFIDGSERSIVFQLLNRTELDATYGGNILR